MFNNESVICKYFLEDLTTSTYTNIAVINLSGFRLLQQLQQYVRLVLKSICSDL
jgi:hypothetical protein